jgi:L-alanine-DL-glutamate epimerase-like enolase superfamily enzyme
MTSELDIRIHDIDLYFLPVTTRIPLKFGPEITTQATCARARVVVETRGGKSAAGWGETPLSVAWVWPSEQSYEARHVRLKDFCRLLQRAWAEFAEFGHPMEIGHLFIEHRLPALLEKFNAVQTGEAMPWLAALVCCSLFDIAVHDAYGVLHEVPTYATYNAKYMNHDLSFFYTPEYKNLFAGRYPEDFFQKPVPHSLTAWHLVGGKDLLDISELTGDEPDDGYPVLLPDWIRRDGLTCLKVKLTGNDPVWDYERLTRVGEIAVAENVLWLTADFNCTVHDPAYVTEILDRLLIEHPRIYGMILYVEQPFPYDLELHSIDVHSVSARKPLFMDESAHDWKFLSIGRRLGWTGVALKTCKTMTGALLSLAWAKAHGMTLMVQDLTNPMLAQIPHVQLAAHAGTIMGVESNGMQFYPDASLPEAAVHPGLYARRAGVLDRSTLSGPGFGYCLDRIRRVLPDPVLRAGS